LRVSQANDKQQIPAEMTKEVGVKAKAGLRLFRYLASHIRKSGYGTPLFGLVWGKANGKCGMLGFDATGAGEYNQIRVASTNLKETQCIQS
jgi:hypothetical protein